MTPQTTALILIGFQNDYFSRDGVLHGVIEESSRITGTLDNTLTLLERLTPTDVTIVSTPIVFTPDYSEIDEPVGILKTIVDVQAFKSGTPGAETIAPIRAFGNRVIEVPGKRGLNAFSATELDRLLRERGIKNVVLAGTVTSICIDSTGRAAFEHGYRVTVLSDCTSSRTSFEQEFYCENVFPLYASVCSYRKLLNRLAIPPETPYVYESTYAS